LQKTLETSKLFINLYFVRKKGNSLKNCIYSEERWKGFIFIASRFDGLEKQTDMVYDRNVLDPSGQTLLFALFAIYHAFF